MKMPEVRARLIIIADALGAGTMSPVTAARKIRVLEKEMYRRPAVRRTPVRGGAPTAAQAAQIRHLAATTTLSQAQIARSVGLTNTGRVSEILAGVRT